MEDTSAVWTSFGPRPVHTKGKSAVSDPVSDSKDVAGDSRNVAGDSRNVADDTVPEHVVEHQLGHDLSVGS